jgi:hypothetical protein
MIRSATARKGEIAVHRAILRALELGMTPSRPCVEGARYDLVIDAGARALSRVQVKYCDHRPRGAGAYEISLTRHCGGRDRRLYRYADDEIDAVVAFLAADDALAWLPAPLWAGRAAVTVRTAPARNGQRRGVHLLDDLRW